MIDFSNERYPVSASIKNVVKSDDIPKALSGDMVLKDTSPSQSSDTVLNLILNMQEKISQLSDNMFLLRKQVCRLELKATGLPVGSDGRAHFSNDSEGINIKIDPSDLLNFKSTLAREGLPIKTSVEVAALETKLGNSESYRTKLVGFNIFKSDYNLRILIFTEYNSE